MWDQDWKCARSQDSNLEDICTWEESKHANRTLIGTSLILSLDTRTCTFFQTPQQTPCWGCSPKTSRNQVVWVLFFGLLNLILHDTYIHWLCTPFVHSTALSLFLQGCMMESSESCKGKAINELDWRSSQNIPDQTRLPVHYYSQITRS